MPFSTSKIFGATIRESANDGSDFTNPDADYRRLFLGEDGLIHLKDSAGAVTDIRDGFHGVHARKTATFPTLTNITFTTLAFDGTDVIDTDAYHDPASNNSRLTIPTGLGGYYIPWCTPGFAANATGARRVAALKNGSLYKVLGTQAWATTSTQPGFTFPVISLVATDYIEFQAWQASGGNLAMDESEGGLYLVGV